MNKANVSILGFTAPYSDSGQSTITVDNSSWVNTYNIYLGGLKDGDPVSTLAVNNNGTMRVGQRMTVFKTGSVTIDSSSKMAVGSGDFGPGGSLRVSSDGELSGSARVHAQVIFAQGGLVSPGNSPGAIAIDGSYEQDAGIVRSGAGWD